MTPFAAIILAAGKSTRMKSRRPKTLHSVAGLPMISHIISALEQSGASKLIVVIGHEADQLRSYLGDRVEYAEQTEQRGTGHAVMMTESLLKDWSGPILVLPGDAPLITPEAIQALINAHADNAITLLTINLPNPYGYGRILRDENDHVIGIIEEKDASEQQRQINEVNISVYAFSAESLFQGLNEVKPDNAQGEFYLTDTVALAQRDQKTVRALVWHDSDVGRGVNSRIELAEIDSLFQKRIQRQHMLNGVSIIDPASTRIEAEVQIAPDSVIHPFTILGGVTDIGEQTEIGPGARIHDSKIGSHVRVRDSWIVASEVGDNTWVGPFANIRPNSTIGKNVRIGDFVEIKSSVLNDNVKAGHFTYLGDATVGSGTNIGAGTITCNYDGVNKHKTVLGENVFTGSNSTLVAPLNVGDDAYIAAGSTITKDVPAGALAIGREHQAIKPGWVAKKRSETDQKEH